MQPVGSIFTQSIRIQLALFITMFFVVMIAKDNDLSDQ